MGMEIGVSETDGSHDGREGRGFEMRILASFSFQRVALLYDELYTPGLSVNLFFGRPWLERGDEDARS